MPCSVEWHRCPPDAEVCQECQIEYVRLFEHLESFDHQDGQENLRRRRSSFGSRLTGERLHHRESFSDVSHQSGIDVFCDCSNIRTFNLINILGSSRRRSSNWERDRLPYHSQSEHIDRWLLTEEDRGGNICWNCSTLPWNDSLRSFEGFVNGVKILEQSGSPCLVCSFFRDFLALLPQVTRPASLNVWKDWNTPVMFKPLFLDAGEPICYAYMDSMDERDVSWSSRLVTPVDPHHAQTVLQHAYPEQIDILMIESWLSECERKHVHGCGLLEQTPLVGVKVIDCERLMVVPAPYNCKFAALSYVWGDESYRRADIQPLERAPKTIKQSIQLVRLLHLKYLWVDRYVSLT